MRNRASQDPSQVDWAGPIALIDLELSESTAEVQVAARYARGVLVLRDHGIPVARMDVALRDGRLQAASYEDAMKSVYQSRSGGLTSESPRLPSATVVVCTRDRADSAVRTVASFEALDYEGDIEILVVDNAPRDDTLARALEARPERPGRPVKRIVENAPGLSRARNLAIEVASGEIIAFTDDDAIAETQWLRALAAGFAAAPDVGCVTGLTLPAELETPAQEWAELFNGLNRGRGFTREVYRVGELGGRHPLYPFPTLGAGVNMAFRRDVLKRLGGFCTDLGVGTGTGGGEDTAILAEILLHRLAIVYEPAAVVRHLHRRDEEGLRRQMYGYGTGVTAYLAWCLHRHPLASLGLVKMTLPVLRYVKSRGASHQAPDRAPVPAFLAEDLRRGLPHGPATYVRAVLNNRRRS